jgi:hypothetical protein
MMNTNAESHGVKDSNQRSDDCKKSNQNKANKRDVMHKLSFVKKH